MKTQSEYNPSLCNIYISELIFTIYIVIYSDESVKETPLY